MTEAKITKQVKAYADKVYASTPFSAELTDAESEHVIAVMRNNRFVSACLEAQKTNGGVCICSTMPGAKEAKEALKIACDKWSGLSLARNKVISEQVKAFEEDLRHKASLLRRRKLERKLWTRP